MPSDWSQERRRGRDDLRRLPPEIQRRLRRVRRDDIRADLATSVLARARDAARTRNGSDLVLAVDEREELRRLLSPTFLRALDKKIDAALRTAHLELIDPGQAHVRVPDGLPEASVAPDSLWVPNEDIDLGVASFLDEPAEAWWAMVGREAAAIAERCRRVRNDGLEDFDGDDVPKGRARVVRVLVLNPGPGGFARAIAALQPAHRLYILEVGSDLTATSFSNVKRARSASPKKAFDLLVWPVPSPGVGGAANHRRIYRDGHGGGLDGVGPRKWRARVRDALTDLVDGLVPNSMAIVRLPLGYRAEHGYVDAPRLLDGLLDNSRVQVEQAFEDRPEGRVHQPFVGSSRCTWRTYVLRGAT